MKKNISLWIATLLLAGGSMLLARQDVTETRDVRSDARIVVENLAGSVTLHGWDREQVKVEAYLGDDVDELLVEGDESYLSIEVEVPRSRGRGQWDLDADLEIWLPRQSRLEVETVSASIEASDLQGRVEFESVSGELDLRGSLREVGLATVSGRIRFAGSSSQMDAESVSGSIRLDGLSGSLEASTVSGRIQVEAETLDRASLESVSGSLELATGLAKGGRLDLESHSANVTLRLDPGVSASFDVQTFSGHIDNELGPDGKKSGRYGPGRRLEFSSGGADGRITIETFSGNVDILRR